MNKRTFAKSLILCTALGWAGISTAQEAFKVGLILPMTGPFASTGRQIESAAKLYMAQHGDTVAGRKVQLILKDDGGSADTTRRLAQELVVNDKVDVLAGFGLTPLALAVAPIASRAQVPTVVMAAATATITEASPFIVRTGFTLPQVTEPLAEWAGKNDIKKVVTLVSDYGPGIDAENAFKGRFAAGGGEVLETLRVPLANPDFAPFLQRVRDLSPDAVFVFVPSGVGSAFMKQFASRGLAEAGIRLIATGDVTDDDLLNGMGDVALDVVTTHHYSAAHDSQVNRDYVKAFRDSANMRPNFHGLGGYDGMHLIYQALADTEGKGGGKALVEAMKGKSWESPRGPMSIDPETRDVIQNVYVRKVERGGDGELYNVEFETFETVKDPVKAAKKAAS
ncbi:MAG: ABC transporter substrate-binding protein [Pigmentiphaga sp.]|nr:ABC transporter substrate-binding protein [Pigmentiphaga sp.]